MPETIGKLLDGTTILNIKKLMDSDAFKTANSINNMQSPYPRMKEIPVLVNPQLIELQKLNEINANYLAELQKSNTTISDLQSNIKLLTDNLESSNKENTKNNKRVFRLQIVIGVLSTIIGVSAIAVAIIINLSS